MARDRRPLGAGAVETYRAAGWRISPAGRPHVGTVTGPCVRCTATTVRYGQRGKPLCTECEAQRQGERDGD